MIDCLLTPRVCGFSPQELSACSTFLNALDIFPRILQQSFSVVGPFGFSALSGWGNWVLKMEVRVVLGYILVTSMAPNIIIRHT